MNYCEKCKIVTNLDVCTNCGNNSLRLVERGDFCFVAELDLLYAKMLQSSLEQQSIPCVLEPIGSVAIALYAISAQKAKIYVPYEYYETAVEIKEAYYS